MNKRAPVYFSKKMIERGRVFRRFIKNKTVCYSMLNYSEGFKLLWSDPPASFGLRCAACRCCTSSLIWRLEGRLVFCHGPGIEYSSATLFLEVPNDVYTLMGHLLAGAGRCLHRCHGRSPLFEASVVGCCWWSQWRAQPVLELLPYSDGVRATR
jgi:hypothetical protein